VKPAWSSALSLRGYDRASQVMARFAAAMEQMNANLERQRKRMIEADGLRLLAILRDHTGHRVRMDQILLTFADNPVRILLAAEWIGQRGIKLRTPHDEGIAPLPSSIWWMLP